MTSSLIFAGGWLPNVKDEAGATHTSFYINVTMTLGNESWRIGRRYSEFYKFYSTIYNQLCKSFPNGMKNIFPSDRLSNWLSLTNQETINDSRRKSLDAWFKELVNNPALMLHDATRKVVYSFLEVDENMAKIVKTSEIVKPTRPIPTHSRSNIAKIPPSIPIPSTAITRPVTSHSSAGSGMPTDRSVRGVSPPPPPLPPPLPLLPAPASIASSEEDMSFAAMKKSALAAQNNDYHSPLSFGPETSTPSTSKHGTEVS